MAATNKERLAQAWKLYQAGDLNAAAGLYRQAVAAEPANVTALWSLGLVCQGLGQFDEAAGHYQAALRIVPGEAKIHNNLGNTYMALGRLAEAEAEVREALRLQPDYANAHNNLGNVLFLQGRLEAAEAGYRQALRINPSQPEAHNGLGAAVRDQGRTDEAAACFREALHLKPDFAEAHNGLGAAVRDLGRTDEAAACFRQALEIKPDFPEAHNGQGNAVRDVGRLDEAAACFREALRLKPDYPEAHKNLGISYLQMGRLAEGWPEYEWRLRCPGSGLPNLAQPVWDGSDLAGRTILLRAEQGLGDTLQFIRYVPLIRERGGTVLVECQPALVKILSRQDLGISRVTAAGQLRPPFDVHAALLSLPHVFGTTLETIPARIPYLGGDGGLSEHWRRVLGPRRAFRIAIAWQGNKTFGGDRQRSIALREFAPLARLEGVELISLQKGDGAEQVAAAGAEVPLLELGPHLDEAAGTFMDTAAILGHMDLVICADSALGHLAGALGVTAWLALAYSADWRWLHGREDSPWYPRHRLFRQPAPGAWPSVFGRMAAELEGRRGLLGKGC